MRPYGQTEIDRRAKALYTRMIGFDSLRNALKIVTGVNKLLKAEKRRRKGEEEA